MVAQQHAILADQYIYPDREWVACSIVLICCLHKPCLMESLILQCTSQIYLRSSGWTCLLFAFFFCTCTPWQHACLQTQHGAIIFLLCYCWCETSPGHLLKTRKELQAQCRGKARPLGATVCRHSQVLLEHTQVMKRSLKSNDSRTRTRWSM